jgi:hypothetical protein
VATNLTLLIMLAVKTQSCFCLHLPFMQSMHELTTWMDFSSAPKLTLTKLGMNIFCGSRIRTLADDENISTHIFKFEDLKLLGI